MEKMLINAIQTEEVRVALVKDRYLFDLDIECPGEVKKRAIFIKQPSPDGSQASMPFLLNTALNGKAFCLLKKLHLNI